MDDRLTTFFYKHNLCDLPVGQHVEVLGTPGVYERPMCSPILLVVLLYSIYTVRRDGSQQCSVCLFTPVKCVMQTCDFSEVDDSVIHTNR